MMTSPAHQAATPNSVERVRWFKEAGFGVFIHWGCYSVLGHGEWAQWREDIHPHDYAQLTEQFAPEHFDARAWARLIRESGAKYAVLTSRHHDGFALWDSEISDFTSVKTAARRDFVKEYVQAIRDEGLKVGLYYSPLDWSWYARKRPRDGTLNWQRFSEDGPNFDPPAWEEFRSYVHAQVRELMTNYGKVDILWYDGCW